MTATHLLHEDEHCFSVLLPLIRQLTLMGELITTQEYRQFKTVGVQVAEVIHTLTDHTQKETSELALHILSTRVRHKQMLRVKMNLEASTYCL